jgi:hypothetical protein
MSNARCSDSEKSGAAKEDSRALIRTISLWTRRCSLDCNKKVNHEMPAERFPSSLAPRYRAQFVSAANCICMDLKNTRQMATKPIRRKTENNRRIKYLDAG